MTSTVLKASHITQLIKNTKRFDKVLQKVKIISLESGKCSAEMTVAEEHTNPMGGLHGGMSATLVDCISTYALMSHEKGAAANVSVDMHLTYSKGANVGEDIVIDANTLRCGKSMAFLEVLIKSKATGDLLVKGSHTKFLIQPK